MRASILKRMADIEAMIRARQPPPTLPPEGERARNNLLDFSLWTKPDYAVNWHHRVLCDYLDRFALGELLRLMVFMPPQNGKSELASRRLPAFLLGRSPDVRVMACSYAQRLASSMNRDVQRIMDTERYRALFPAAQLPGNGPSKQGRSGALRNNDLFEMVGRRGSYRSAGVGQGIVGLPFDVGIIDDPLSGPEQAYSAVQREAQWEWYQTAFTTRQAPGARILIITTRWHDDDLPGRLLKLQEDDAKADRWAVVRFPGLAEGPGDRMAEDPRQEGEPLWPARYPLEWLEAKRAGMPSRMWYPLYQARALADDGAVFKGTWFLKRFKDTGGAWQLDGRGLVYHNQAQVFAVVDPAASEKQTGDFTAIGVFAVTHQNDLLVLDMIRERLGVEGIVPRLAAVCEQYRPQYVAIEANGFQVAICKEARRRQGMPPIREVQPASRSKLVRATEAVVRAETGQVYLRHAAPWIPKFLDELVRFTGLEDAHDDQVDVLAYACRLQGRKMNETQQGFRPYVQGGR